MLPLQLVYDVKQSILDYLKFTFSFKERVVAGATVDKCERIQDYRLTWAHFDTIIKD